MSDELMSAFIEDSREHLESIEADILALENMGGDFDEELVNRIFRTAHSIKGAAGFLGLTAIGALAHKLENALHLMREGQLPSDQHVCQILLQGFDTLSDMINDPETSECRDITDIIEEVKGLLTPESQASAETNLTFASTDGHRIFDVDLLTLDQALTGGKFLYHIEFDLIHDIQRRDKTPYDIIKTLQDGGLILDCKVDVESVGSLEKGISNTIPMNVLYASIIDQEIIRSLVSLPPEKVREMDKDMFHRQGQDQFVDLGETASPGFATVQQDGARHDDLPENMRLENGAAVVVIGEAVDAAQAGALHETLLEALRRSPHVRLDMRNTEEVDASFVQLAASTYQSCLRKNGSFGFLNLPPKPVAESLCALGLGWLVGGAA